jgi:hypothetical protein
MLPADAIGMFNVTFEIDASGEHSPARRLANAYCRYLELAPANLTAWTWKRTPFEQRQFVWV